MRKIFLFIISLAVGAACAKAQADTIFVVGSQFGSFSTVNDSTFQVVCDHPTDDLGQGFSGNGIYKGYFAFDVVGNIFRVDSVLVRGVSQTTLWLTEQQNSIGPVGRGIIYRSPDNSVCVPQIPVGYISNATVAKIQNHNTVNGCGGNGGSGANDAASISVNGANYEVVPSSNLQVFADQVDAALLNSRNTGVRTGGVATVDGGLGASTNVSFTAGKGQILDNSDPLNVMYYPVTWVGSSGVALANTSEVLTYWYVDSLGVLNQQTTDPTGPERRTRIYLAVTSYTASVGAITGISPVVTPTQHTPEGLADFSGALGAIKTSGIQLASAGTGLTFRVTSGLLFDFGAGWNNSELDPHNIVYPEFNTTTGGTFRYATSTGINAANVTDIDVANYQSGGVVTPIPGNVVQDRYGIHYIFVFPGTTANYRAVYGDNFYDTAEEAAGDISYEKAVSIAPNGFEQFGILLGAIIAEKDETTNANFVFVSTNKFGLFGGALVSAAQSDAVQSIQPGFGIDVDATAPQTPIVSADTTEMATRSYVDGLDHSTLIPADSVTITPIAQLPASTNAQEAFVELATNADANSQVLNAVRILTGMPILSENLGSFTGTTISDNTTIKNALQELETATEASISGTLTENVIPVADASGNLEDSGLSQDATTVSMDRGLYVDRGKSWSETNYAYGGGTVSGTGYVIIETGVIPSVSNILGVSIDIGFYHYTSYLGGAKPGKITLAALYRGDPLAIFNANAYTIGNNPAGSRIQVATKADKSIVIILGEATSSVSSVNYWVDQIITQQKGERLEGNVNVFISTDLSSYTLSTAMTSTNISTVPPVTINARSSNPTDVSNGIVIGNNRASSLGTRCGIAFRPSSTPLESLSDDQGYTIEAIRGRGIVFRTETLTSVGANSVETARFGSNGKVAFGAGSLNDELSDNPTYSLEVLDTDASLFLTPHDLTIVETEGLFVADNSEDKFYYHDGVQRQYPVWESENPMFTFNLTDGTNTSAIGNNATVAFIGSNGVKNTLAGTNMLQEMDVNSLLPAGALDNTFRFAAAASGAASRSVDIDDLATYINQTAGDGNGLADGSVTIPDGVVTAINSDGAGITWNADNLDLSAISLSMNGEPYRANDTIIVNHPAHDFQTALTTGTTYRPWRVPADLDGARIIAINYALATNGSGDVVVQITDGTINTSAGTIPAATGYVDVNGAVTLTAGDKWTPSVFSISGTGHEGLTVQFIIERQ